MLTTTLPELHAHLDLRYGDDLVWRSRVEAIDAYALTIARPFDLPLEDGPAVGGILEMTWAADGGSFTVPVELLEVARDGLVALWIVAPRGEVTRSQRRAHFRLGHDAPVSVRLEDSEIACHLVDVSEAAVRVRVGLDEAELFPDGTPLTAVFEIRQDRFDLGGTVLRTWPSERHNGDPAADIVVLLDLSEAQARDLRRALLAEQVHRRRLER